jgi:hypothetical protein
MGSEAEEIFIDRNSSRNKYLVNKEILGVNSQSKLMKAIAQDQKETLTTEINRQRNECLGIIGRLINIQDQISDAAKNHILLTNPYYMNRQVGLMKSSTEEIPKQELKIEKIFNDQEKTNIASQHKMLNHIGS